MLKSALTTYRKWQVTGTHIFNEFMIFLEILIIFRLSVVYLVDFINEKPEIDLKFGQQLFLSLKC